MYMKNFGEFFNDQVENASCIVLSHTKNTSEEKLLNAVELLKAKNSTATVVTADWDSLDGKTLLAAIENKNGLSDELARLKEEVHHHGGAGVRRGAHQAGEPGTDQGYSEGLWRVQADGAARGQVWAADG